MFLQNRHERFYWLFMLGQCVTIFYEKILKIPVFFLVFSVLLTIRIPETQLKIFALLLLSFSTLEMKATELS